jgi:hypothetical protein
MWLLERLLRRQLQGSLVVQARVLAVAAVTQALRVRVLLQQVSPLQAPMRPMQLPEETLDAWRHDRRHVRAVQSLLCIQVAAGLAREPVLPRQRLGALLAAG